VVHRGKDAIAAIIRTLFDRFPGAIWSIDHLNEDKKGAVSLEFEMNATDESGAPIQRRGHERFVFNQKGLIRSATMKLKG